MPIPISDSSIKLVWENNADTSLTASRLSKSVDFVASYRDFELEPLPRKEGTILYPESGGLTLLLKRQTLFSIVNEAEKNGESVLSVNDHYRMFDIGLQDLRLTILDMDDNVGNPTDNWGADKEWFVYICDKVDSSLQKSTSDEYGGGAQILISQGKNYPVAAVPGDTERSYSAEDTRKIGGFKSDASGSITEGSVWDISGKFNTVKAKEYYILDEYGSDADDSFGRHLYRKLRVSDLDSSAGANNIFNNSVTVVGNFEVQDFGNTSRLTLDVESGILTLDTPSTFNEKVVMNGDADINNVTITDDGVFTGGGPISFNTVDDTTNNYLYYRSDDDAFHLVSSENLDDFANADLKVRGLYANDEIIIGSSGSLRYNNTAPTGTAVLGYEGYFYASRVYNAIWNDLAEYFLSSDEEVPGKVYSVDKDRNIKISDKKNDKGVVGVCSDTFGFALKDEYRDHGGVPIALAGTVPVWVKSTVEEGDELCSDSDGFAKKASWITRIFKRGTILGKAMEQNIDSNKKRILMLVK